MPENRRKSSKNEVAEALVRTLETPCYAVNLIEPANVVDGLFEVAKAIRYLADKLSKTEQK